MSVKRGSNALLNLFIKYIFICSISLHRECGAIVYICNYTVGGLCFGGSITPADTLSSALGIGLSIALKC